MNGFDDVQKFGKEQMDRTLASVSAVTNGMQAIVAEPSNRPVLMHCAQGVRRTGMFMAAYQLSIMDRSVAVTKARIMPFGHKPADLDDIRTFIDNYDPIMATVPTTMPAVSKE